MDLINEVYFFAKSTLIFLKFKLDEQKFGDFIVKCQLKYELYGTTGTQVILLRTRVGTGTRVLQKIVFKSIPTYNKKSKILFVHERLQSGRKWMFLYWKFCNGGPVQIPLR